MSPATVTLVVLFALTFMLKASGPVLFGGRALPDRLDRLVNVLPAPLLAALVATSTFVDDRAIVVDARALGLLAAALALACRLPFVAVVLIAAMVTAGARAIM